MAEKLDTSLNESILTELSDRLSESTVSEDDSAADDIEEDLETSRNDSPMVPSTNVFASSVSHSMPLKEYLNGKEQYPDKGVIDLALVQLDKVPFVEALYSCKTLTSVLRLAEACCPKLTMSEYENAFKNYIKNRNPDLSNTFDIAPGKNYASDAKSGLAENAKMSADELDIIPFSSFKLTDLDEKTRPNLVSHGIDYNAARIQIEKLAGSINLQKHVDAVATLQCAILTYNREVLETRTQHLMKLLLERIIDDFIVPRDERVDIRDALGVDLSFQATRRSGQDVTVKGHSDLFIAPIQYCVPLNRLPPLSQKQLVVVRALIELKGFFRAMREASRNNSARSQHAAEIHALVKANPCDRLVASMATDLLVGWLTLSLKIGDNIYHMSSVRTYNAGELVIMLCLLVVNPDKLDWGKIIIPSNRHRNEGINAYITWKARGGRNGRAALDEISSHHQSKFSDCAGTNRKGNTDGGHCDNKRGGSGGSGGGGISGYSGKTQSRGSNNVDGSNRVLLNCGGKRSKTRDVSEYRQQVLKALAVSEDVICTSSGDSEKRKSKVQFQPNDKENIFNSVVVSHTGILE